MLRNRLGITTAGELAQAEAELTRLGDVQEGRDAVRVTHLLVLLAGLRTHDPLHKLMLAWTVDAGLNTAAWS